MSLKPLTQYLNKTTKNSGGNIKLSAFFLSQNEVMLLANCTILSDNKTPGVPPQIPTKADPLSEDREPRVLTDPGIQPQAAALSSAFL